MGVKGNRSAAEIKCLTDGDIAEFRALLSVFGEAFDDLENYTARQPGDGYLADLLRDQNMLAVTASRNRKVIGGLVAYEFKKFEQERSEIYIYDLAVEAMNRRHGVATDMIEFLKAIAKERGAYVVFVQADYDDDAAIALYSKLGIREQVLHFDIAVE